MKHLEARAALLRVKECDLRMDCLLQCDTSIDRGLHVGGAFSSLTAMTALYYSGLAAFNVTCPTDTEQDLFVLSKGHAVAALAAVYADLGYISHSDLYHSRGYGAAVKGHPGPVLPGVPVATGPLGHGISICCGYAMRRMELGRGNVYCMVGDGELQEGSCWEGAALAADRGLRNLCVLVDQNNGQSDDTKKLVVRMDDAAEKFAGFGFRVLHADSNEMESVLLALETFTTVPSDRPTAIICHTRKGHGGQSAITGLHKASMSEDAVRLEMNWQQLQRAQLVQNLNRFDAAVIDNMAAALHFAVERSTDGMISDCRRLQTQPLVQRAQPRDKQLRYAKQALPGLKPEERYATYGVVKEAMRVFASDARLYTVDSDLANASGLYDGASVTNRAHAVNVGIAECNMMCVAEAFASEGANVFTSTFSPFFDQRALRRIAVSYQERQEAIDAGSWLSEGHNLDITFLATSANLETAVNGATHMGNDDMSLAYTIAGLKVIDVGCPQMLQSVLKWIAEGNRGLVYLRTMKTPVRPIYAPDFCFQYATAYCVMDDPAPAVILVSSGHGVYEALEAGALLQKAGVPVRVIDMPSIDEAVCRSLAESNVPVLFAEQNNGALFAEFSKLAFLRHWQVHTDKIYTVNTASPDGQLRFIQSGTYAQLTQAFGLNAAALAEQAAVLVKQ